MIDVREFLVWACGVSKLSPRQTEAVVLVLAEGYRPAATAAHMGVSTNTACCYYREGAEKLAVQEWQSHELELFERMVEATTDDETAMGHAIALLAAVRNSQDPTPRPAEYDSNGRRVASRDPLVDVEDVLRIGRNTRTLPSKLRLPRISSVPIMAVAL
jgi:hypothetical protein